MGGLFSQGLAPGDTAPESVAKSPAPAGPGSIRIAICFAYLATRFQRYEFIWNEIAVENLVLDALIEANLVAPDAFNRLPSLSWSAATHPEPGVHAAAQVLALEIACPPIPVDQLCALLSRSLHRSAQIRFWSVIQVPRHFHASTSAEIEEYCYLLPATVLASGGRYAVARLSEVVIPEFMRSRNCANYGRGVLHSVRIGNELNAQGCAFVPIFFSGARFDCQGIRKMVAVMIGFASNAISIDVIRRTLRREKWTIPVAPAMFLFLRTVRYPFFVRKYGRSGCGPDVEFAHCRPMMVQWQQEELLPEIIAGMARNDPFATFSLEALAAA
jgi:tRNA pseudouridine(38-40) synthase